MNKIFLFIFLIFVASGCATNKIDKERCKDIYGYFTKAKDCLALKFESSNPKKYKKYKDTHILILEALTNLISTSAGSLIGETPSFLVSFNSCFFFINNFF